MFGFSTLRLCIYAGVALLVIALGIGLKYQTDRASRLASTANQLTAQLQAERLAKEHERQIAEDATNDYEAKLKHLEAARAAIPTRVVRLCKQAPAVPTASAAAIGTVAGTAGEQPPEARQDLEAGPDIGAALYAFADEADQRAAACNALIKWVRSR